MKRVCIALAASLGVFAVGTAIPIASGTRIVTVEDRCDPATFNEAVRPGTCVGSGNVLFSELAAELNPVDFGHDAWRFNFGRARVERGETLRAKNEGGEFHTFTEVAQFGGGCVDELNAPLGIETQVPECLDKVTLPVVGEVPRAFLTTGVNPGASRDIAGLDKAGTHHKFQCLIHPWMRVEVDVR